MLSLIWFALVEKAHGDEHKDISCEVVLCGVMVGSLHSRLSCGATGEGHKCFLKRCSHKLTGQRAN